MSRAWSLIAVGSDQQYAGNRGYEDLPARLYRYDSNVPNSRNLQAGDLVFVRNSDRILGIAQIDSVAEKPATKIMLRCPVCGITGLKERQRKQPRFRCDNGHEFATPREDPTEVTAFEAHYERSFLPLSDAIPLADLKAAALRPSDQLSIEEVDARRLEPSLVRAHPDVRSLLANFFHLSALDANAAEDESEGSPPAGTGEQTSTYNVSPSDSRESVLRAIKQRRGQAGFRMALLRRFGGRCVVTGCSLSDVLEAAHIWPYRGPQDNHPDNGLLLRADIHTLYDLDLIAVDPERLKIVTAPVLSGVDPYDALSGQSLRTAIRPAADPLLRRWRAFQLRWLHGKGPEAGGPAASPP